VKTVQARLGHATAQQTLDVYGHLWPDSEERTRAALEALAGQLGLGEDADTGGQ
jgi:integrase